MRSATMDSGLIKKSNGEKIFVDMLDQELSDIMSKGSVNGLADMLYQQLSQSLLSSVDDDDSQSKTGSSTVSLNDDDILMQRLKLNSTHIDSDGYTHGKKRDLNSFDLDRAHTLGVLGSGGNVRAIDKVDTHKGDNTGTRSADKINSTVIDTSVDASVDASVNSSVVNSYMNEVTIMTGEEFVRRY